MINKEKTNVFYRIFLYFILFGIFPWPLFFFVNIVGLILMSFAVLPFSLDFSRFDLIVRILTGICVIIPYILSGVIYYFICRKMLFKVSGPLNLIIFFIVIIPTIFFKIIILHTLTQISSFSSHAPLSIISSLTYILLEIMIIIGTITAFIIDRRVKI